MCSCACAALDRAVRVLSWQAWHAAGSLAGQQRTYAPLKQQLPRSVGSGRRVSGRLHASVGHPGPRLQLHSKVDH